MRCAVLLLLCLTGCAKFKTADPLEPDLAAAEEDLATAEDLAEGAPDLRDVDLSGVEDLRPIADLSQADLNGVQQDLRQDMSGPPPDLSQPDLSGADLAAMTYMYPRINEVAPGVGGVALDEYIELIGGETDTPLFGWSLWYQEPGMGIPVQIYSFPALAVLKARRYLLISTSGSVYEASTTHLYTSTGSGRLGPNGGAVALVQGLTRIDSVGWGTATGGYLEGAAAASPGAQACGRLPDGIDTDRNQRDFATIAPTPLTQNR